MKFQSVAREIRYEIKLGSVRIRSANEDTEATGRDEDANQSAQSRRVNAVVVCDHDRQREFGVPSCGVVFHFPL
uniref:Uncharacterized protein n=1 Tax=Rhizophora mucronata TaxID=61149 RepID=A0A2P2KBP6_RHIMU